MPSLFKASSPTKTYFYIETVSKMITDPHGRVIQCSLIPVPAASQLMKGVVEEFSVLQQYEGKVSSESFQSFNNCRVIHCRIPLSPTWQWAKRFPSGPRRHCWCRLSRASCTQSCSDPIISGGRVTRVRIVAFLGFSFPRARVNSVS